MAGHIGAELNALATLAETLISGEYLEVESNFEYEEDGVKITVMPVMLNLREYLFTIEERGDEMSMQLRSTQIPELLISLPAPLLVKFGKPMVLEELC
mgnify:FL=1